MNAKSGTRVPALFPALGVIAILAMWVAIWLFSGYSIIPSPWETLQETFRLLLLGHTWRQILITAMRVGSGFLLALATGTLAGMLAGRARALELFFRPITLFLQGIPPLLWVIPLILLFGIGHLSPVFVIALICFPLVAINISEGMKSVPSDLEEMVGVLAPGTFPRLREVVLPHLRPFFTATLALGVALGLKASVVGEFFGANNGIGFQLQAAYQSLQIKRLFSWGLILVLLILASSRILNRRGGRASRGSQASVSMSGRAPRIFTGTGTTETGITATGAASAVTTLRPGGASGANQVGQDAAAERAARQTGETEFSEADGDALLGALVPHDEYLRVEAAGAGPLVVEGLSFAYPLSSPLLEDISFTVNPGEVAVITGESGIGKSTLLKLVGGIGQPSRGKVRRPERVGFVFQDDRLIPWRTLLGNTAFPLRYLGFSAESGRSLARTLLQEFGLRNEEEKYPDELSGGMRKRAGFARCFARLPGLVLLDEPFLGLHREARKTLWRKFYSLLEGYSVPAVIVTHYPEEMVPRSRFSFYNLAGAPARLTKVSPQGKRKSRAAVV